MSIAKKTKNFLERLQNLSEKKKKIILWVVVIILAVTMLSFWIGSALKSFSKMSESLKIPSIESPNDSSKNSTADIFQNMNQDNENAIAAQTADWKIYTNSNYNFQIKYPLDWTFREYNSGAAFYPKDKPNEQGSVVVGFYKRGLDYCKIPFDDYVKIAGPSEIQNYESLNTINQGEASDGTKTYQTTWNYTDLQGVGKISLPITYFETKIELCGDVEMLLNDNNYSDIYNKIISTFKFTPINNKT